MMLELGGIDMSVVQTFTRNTPLLMLLKVIEKDGPQEVEVAGAAVAAIAERYSSARLIFLQLP
jgi:hypothetical protein